MTIGMAKTQAQADEERGTGVVKKPKKKHVVEELLILGEEMRRTDEIHNLHKACARATAGARAAREENARLRLALMQIERLLNDTETVYRGDTPLRNIRNGVRKVLDRQRLEKQRAQIAARDEVAKRRESKANTAEETAKLKGRQHEPPNGEDEVQF